MDNKHPLVSILTVSYNAVKTIEQTMLSVLNQTYPNIEYIIIDGGSTDGTVDIIKKYADRLAYWVSESDRGIYDAMNKGIKKTMGKWINFMNSGDSFYNKDVLSNVFSLVNNEDYVIGVAVLPSNQFWKPIRVDFTLKDVINGGAGNHQASFIKKNILKEGYDPTLKILSDEYLFIKQVVLNRCSYLPLNVFVCRYDTHGMSNNRKNRSIIRLERNRYLKEMIPPRILDDYMSYNRRISIYRLKRLMNKILFKLRIKRNVPN